MSFIVRVTSIAVVSAAVIPTVPAPVSATMLAPLASVMEVVFVTVIGMYTPPWPMADCADPDPSTILST